MSRLENLTIVVTSCDKYHEAWDLLFPILKKQGGDLADCPIILNTETLQYTYEGLDILTTSTIKDTTGWSWGRRVKFALTLVKTDYVLFIMEDMYLQRQANIEVFAKCINWLDSNRNIACFNLEPLHGAEEKSAKYQGFSIVQPGTPYRINAQACIWRKEDLDKSMLPEESPWDWEILGNMRNDYIFQDKEVYALSWGEEEPFFMDLYLKEKDSTGRLKTHNGIMRGKWDIKLVKPLCEEYGIKINFENLGIYKEEAVPFKQRIKMIFPFSLMYKVYRCIRKRKYDEIAKRDELNLKSSEKYQKLVAPYIDDKA